MHPLFSSIATVLGVPALLILATDTWIFWVALVIAFGCCSWSASKESSAWTSFLVVVSLVLLAVFTTFNPFSYAYEHPITVSIGLVAYLAIGTCWSFWQWGWYAHEQAQELRQNLQQYARDYSVWRRPSTQSREDHQNVMGSGWPTDVSRDDVEFRKWVRNKHHQPVQMTDNISRISYWLAFWPFSFAYETMHTLIWRIAEFIIRRFRGVYDALTNRFYANAWDDHA